MTDPHRSYSDAELSTLDLAALLGEGITGPDGALRADLQGIGSAAAAIQLDNQFVTSTQVAQAASGAPPGFVPPALEQLVNSGRAACRDEADDEAFTRWLGMVGGLLVLRERARE